MKKIVSILLALLLILFAVHVAAEDLDPGEGSEEGDSPTPVKMVTFVVDYYKDAVSEGNFLDRLDEEIAVNASLYAPEGYVTPGKQGEPEVISEDEDSMVYLVNVVYLPRIDLSYTVYYLDGNSDEELAPVKLVDGQTMNASITEVALDIEGYMPVFPQITKNLTAGENDFIFYYSRDYSFTKPTWYKVEHWVAGEHRPDDDVIVYATAWLYEENPKIMVTGESLAVNMYSGYDFIGYEMLVAPGDMVDDGTVIRMAYGQMLYNELIYEVRYYFNGVMSANDRLVFTENVMLHDTIDVYPSMIRSGYRLSHTANFPLTVDIENSKNIIHVYYVTMDAPFPVIIDLDLPLSAGLGTLNVGDCVE